ncbi:hypothetical protein OUZ56_021297 [Daphnia magna]|uniref:Uncharacterized protein n=1 Tax=Daphnia magna TaxID=35525 RepID=A0ABQ9ZGZ7_9CRUS|nr:hypothetical protein OUZ56_021297 [Daphnia magna]
MCTLQLCYSKNEKGVKGLKNKFGGAVASICVVLSCQYCGLRVVRIQPLVPKEITEGSQHFITKWLNQPQVTVKGSTEAFTYDSVFGPEESQIQVYETAVMKVMGKYSRVTMLSFWLMAKRALGKHFQWELLTW